MKIKKIVLWLLASLLILVSVGAVVTIMTPYPASYLIRAAFEGGMEVKPVGYDLIEARVQVTENVSYDSKYRSGDYDHFSPRDYDGTLPVIVWVHGGAFVGGDKDDIDAYATQIADKGYHVISMNYQRAPEGVYPLQMNQINELITHLKGVSNVLNLDMDQIFMAGDSAGAHMVAQFALIQTDPSYAKKVGIDPVIDPSVLKGNLLLCGPYDLQKFSDLANGNKIMDFFLSRAAWAYLGDKNWLDNPEFKSLSIVDEISENFPASFITDGTVNTFTAHGITLAEKLVGMGVDVTSVFYDEEGLELQHEYQFQMDNDYSVNTFNKLVEFLDNHSN